MAEKRARKMFSEEQKKQFKRHTTRTGVYTVSES